MVPSTEVLDLGFTLEPPTVSGTFPLECLLDLQQLRSLTIDATPQGQWTVKVSSIQYLLLQLSNLYGISLTVSHIEHDWCQPVDENPVIAPIEYFELAYYPTLLTGLQPFQSLPFVTELVLAVDPFITTPLEVASFICDVASHPRLILFSMSGDRAGDESLFALNVEHVLPLFSSRTLQCVTLDCLMITSSSGDSQTSVVDAIIETLKQYHGPLKELQLSNSIHPMPIFDSLMKFAEYAPWLTELSIGACVPRGWASHLPNCSQLRFRNSLRQLSISNLDQPFSLDDGALLAKCIDAWFPNLDRVRCWEDFSTLPSIDELRAELKDTRLTGASQTYDAPDARRL